jgi:hypothetical protein
MTGASRAGSIFSLATMSILTFILGLACGLALSGLGLSPKALRVRLRNRLGEDEKYLLNVARAAGGRLIVREERVGAAPPTLRLREIPDHRVMESRGQMDRLQNRGLVKPDPSGLPGRHLMTPEGWDYVKGLTPLPVEVKRAGNWFNSISKRPRR